MTKKYSFYDYTDEDWQRVLGEVFNGTYNQVEEIYAFDFKNTDDKFGKGDFCCTEVAFRPITFEENSYGEKQIVVFTPFQCITENGRILDLVSRKWRDILSAENENFYDDLNLDNL